MYGSNKYGASIEKRGDRSARNELLTNPDTTSGTLVLNHNNDEKKQNDRISIDSDSFASCSSEQPPTKSSTAVSIASQNRKAHQIDDLDDEPEGGYGWLVVLGSSLASFTVFGTMMSWGVMQNYCVHYVFGDSDKNRVLVSFAGTLCYFISDVFTPFACMLESVIGTQPALLLGTFLVSGGLIASGSATEIWHLYLSHGICFGLGSSIMYIVTMTITSEWFNKRRSTANGIVTSSIGLAGLITPIIMTASNAKLGVNWTFRILGFTFFAANLVTTVLVKQKHPQVRRPSKSLSGFIQWDLLRNVNLQIWIISAFLQVLCIFVPYFFLPSYATYLGLSTVHGSSLVSVTAAMSCLGRISVGVLADSVGNLNAGIIFSLIGGLASLLIWTFAYTYLTLMLYAATFGFFGGSYYTVLAPTLRFLLGAEQFHSGFSLLMVMTSLAIVGPTIASSIESLSPFEPFLSYKLFCGFVSITSCVVTLILKLRLDPRLLAQI